MRAETPVEKSKAAGPDVIEIDDEDSVVLIQSSYNLSDVCEYSCPLRIATRLDGHPHN